jgi:hypothetical protein
MTAGETPDRLAYVAATYAARLADVIERDGPGDVDSVLFHMAAAAEYLKEASRVMAVRCPAPEREILNKLAGTFLSAREEALAARTEIARTEAQR